MLQRFAFVLALPACTGPAANATLADLPSPRVSLQLWSARDASPRAGFVALGYDDEAFRAAHGDDCATLGDAFHITVNGTDLGDIARGGNGEDFGDCGTPGVDFALDVPTDRDTTIVLRDQATTITATYAAASLAPRTATPRSTGDWSFAPGETVTLAWSHPDDFASLPSDPYAITFNNNGDGDDFPLSPTYAGDEITFTIPEPPPSTGAGLVGIHLSYATGDAIVCEGATSCKFSSERGYEHRAAIE